MLELDTKLRDFVDTCIEVDNYRQKVKDKYDTLDILDVAKITEIIEKFKAKHLDIALVWRVTKPKSQNFSFDTQWIFLILDLLRWTGEKVSRCTATLVR